MSDIKTTTAAASPVTSSPSSSPHKPTRPIDLRISLKNSVARLEESKSCRTRFAPMTTSEVAEAKALIQAGNNKKIDKWIADWLQLRSAGAAAVAVAASPPPPISAKRRKRKWNDDESDELNLQLVCADGETRPTRTSGKSSLLSVVRLLISNTDISTENLILVSLLNGEVLVNSKDDPGLLHHNKLSRCLAIWADESNNVRLFVGSQHPFTYAQEVEYSEPITRIWIRVVYRSIVRVLAVYDRLPFDVFYDLVRSAFGLPRPFGMTMVLPDGRPIPCALTTMGASEWLTRSKLATDSEVTVADATTTATATATSAATLASHSPAAAAAASSSSSM